VAASSEKAGAVKHKVKKSGSRLMWEILTLIELLSKIV
jgi:hypothetical protein